VTTANEAASDAPPQDALADLLLRLGEAKQFLDAGEDPLACSLGALAAVIDFVASRPDVLRLNLLEPLYQLMNAIGDRLEGGKPPLLFARPSVGKRPSGQSFDSVRAAVAIAVEVLMMRGGKSRKEAGAFVARLCDAAGLRRGDGKPISCNNACNWRDRSTDTSDVVCELRREFEPVVLSVSPSSPAEAEKLARTCIEAVQDWGF
jgi:hypothetical protein